MCHNLTTKQALRFVWMLCGFGIFISNLCSVFLFPPNLWVRWVGDLLLENLAKSGYRSERRVEKFRIYPLFWGHAKVYCLNMAISQKKKKKKKKNLIMWWIWAIYFPQKKAFISLAYTLAFLLSPKCQNSSKTLNIRFWFC